MLDRLNTKSHQALRPKDAEKLELLTHHLPFVSAFDDETILLRDGDVMGSFIVDGVSAGTSDENDISDLALAFSNLISQQQSDVGFAVHRISTVTQPSLDRVDGRNEFAEAVDATWQSFLSGAGLRSRTVMVTVTIRPSRIAGMSRWFGGAQKQQLEDVAKRRERLNQVITQLTSTLGASNPRRLTISSGEWLGYLRSLLTGIYAPLKPGRKFAPLNDLISNTCVKFTGDIFTTVGHYTGNTRVGTVLTLKDYPNATRPGIYDTLDAGVDMVVTNTFTPADRVAALNQIQRVARQMGAADDAARSLRMQLEDAADDQASGRVVFGEHHCTITIFADNEEELNDMIGFVTNSVTYAGGGSVIRESFAARTSFFAQFPGNYSYRTRASMISSANFSEFASLHGAAKGRAREFSPWGEAVTILPTGNGEPYRFNFHLAGDNSDEDSRPVGHTLVLGMTGSGKTLGTAFMIAQAMRCNPRIIVFDKDRGMEMPLRALGGSYTDVRVGLSTGFNPFAAESDERGVAWLTDWFETLLSVDGPLSAVQREALSRATTAMLTAPPELKNMQQFRTQFRGTDDGGELYTRLGRWDEGGQFGWLFDGKGEDPLTFEDDVIGFDLSEIFNNRTMRTAWLSYVFQRIERAVEDASPTLIVMDEAWKLLDDDYFESKLKDWMLTMRKKNVAVVLLTQRVSHITESKAGGSILESTATRILYPSSKIKAAELAPLNLNDNEAEFLQTSNVDNHFCLIQSGEDNVIADFNLRPLGPYLKILGGGPGEKFPEGWRDNPVFWKEV